MNVRPLCLFMLLLTALAMPAQANLDALSNQDAVAGLKAAL